MTGGNVTQPLDQLDDRRLAAAVEVLRFLRRVGRRGHASWWYAAGTHGWRAAMDLADAGRAATSPDGGGVHVTLRRTGGGR